MTGFKHNTQTLISEQNMHPWCRCEPLWIHRSIHYITILWCTWTKISQYMDICPMFRSESLLYEFWIFLLVGWRPCFHQPSAWHDCSKQTEEWQLHFATKWGIKHEKMNQVLQLACFSKTQKPTGCGTTTRKYQLLMDSLPPLRQMHA